MREATQLRQILKRESCVSDLSVRGTVTGIVESFDAKSQSAKVTLQPYGFTTGYLPIHSQWAGNGWGMFSPPPVGSYVTVQFEGGDLGTGHIIGRAHNDEHKPLPTPAGEFWAVHSTGSKVQLLNDGTVQVASINGAGSITLTPDGKIVIGTVAGASTVMIGRQDELHRLLTDVAADIYNQHTHNYQGHKTSNPSVIMGPEALTVETKAS